MDDLQFFIAALLVSVAILNSLANWLDVPYPIVLVVGGLGLATIPGAPEIELDPDLVLLLFLPPLLYVSAFNADLNALRADLRTISLNAIGLVILTAAVVAVVAHAAFGMTWPVAFALGAILAPTDPVAATAIMRRLGAPRRLVNNIEGESLINDASALVLYRVAVAATVGEGFSAGHAALQLIAAIAGGIGIGLLVGYAIAAIRARLDDPATQVTISLFTGYAAFLPAEELGVSGVLAAVTAGVYLGWRAPTLVAPDIRLRSVAMWDTLIFLLNATLFILIGLQLPVVLDGIEGSGTSLGAAVGYAAIASAVVIVTRFVWIFTMTVVIRTLDRRPQQLARRASAGVRTVAGWSGMRGAVSLAAALALPLTTDAGAPLPDRDLVLFITFGVILVTLVGQGLTLPFLIRRLGVHEDGSEEEHEEIRARVVVATAALERVEELELEDWTNDDTIERMRGMYQFRRRRFKVRAGKIEDPDGIEDRSMAYQRLMHELYAAQRSALVELRNTGEVSVEVMRRIERELDLEESRLEV